MILFIALPIGSIFVQSFFIEHEKVFTEVEVCNPFGCKTETKVDTQATEQLQKEKPLGKFNGLGTYLNRNHLALNELVIAWEESETVSEFFAQMFNFPFYKALGFTLAYTFIVTPFVIILGFLIALAVNTVSNMIKGVVIFFSLLPMIITPLIGSLILFWMIDADGIIGSLLKLVFDDPDLSLKASPTLTWITLMFYGIWHSAPFAFIVFYAGLQTVPQDVVESSMMDGANIIERIRYIIIPHLMPLFIFVGLMQLMDNFRVFEPIVGFNAEASATSLSWIIYNDLRPEGTAPLFSSAAATSVLTILGLIILLYPVLKRNYNEHKQGTI